MEYYVELNDLLTDSEILDIAREHLKNKTVPFTGIGTSKSMLQSRIITAMMFLQSTEREADE